LTALLETEDLTRRFGGVCAVDSVRFSLAERELRCLIGPNGAGKSTFFKLITGQLRPSAGRVLMRGRDITGAEPHEAARLGMGIKTQVPSVFDGLNVRENLLLAALRRMAPRAAARRSDELLALVRLESRAAILAGHLAHGQRQWLELAMVLAGEPSLVLLDEPTAGMTREEVARTAELVREINRSRTLIVVEHDMQFVRMLAASVTVFHQGRVVAEGGVEDILANPLVRSIYLGQTVGDA
jgi:ABC-type uncharacterized transport system ATPase subunit